ncbi:MAG: hypothetical protein M1820_010854 [Bogoriella megaspora]|nr:MAG: hypothetical protein M1820_010854 [Bogoriella megaspora]
MLLILLSLLAFWALNTQAADAADWRSRSIYQVLTDRFARADGSTTATCNTGDRAYCGGSWNGIANQLSYIKNMGFTAIWISPITLNLQGSTGDGTSYHGYWQQNMNAVNTPFGSSNDLKSLISAVHAQDMYIMVDVVVNHCGWIGDDSSVDFSKFAPLNKESDYHPYCSTDYSNQTSVEQCWEGDETVTLPDFKTEDSSVASTLYSWAANLVSEYNIDGLRLDSAAHVDAAFWPEFNAAVGVYCLGEVFDDRSGYVCNYQNGLDGVLNYPSYYNITDAFESTSGDMAGLARNINTMKSTCKDTTLLGSFSENHDVPRFAQKNPDMNAAMNVLAYTILADGIPIVYQGQEQHYNSEGGSSDPYNREALWLSGFNTEATLYTTTAKLNQIRNHALSVDGSYLTYQNWPIYQDTTTVAMRKGSDGKAVITVLSNKGSNGASYTQNIPNTGLDGGAAVTEILSCDTLTAGSDGSLTVPMANGLPRVYYLTSLLSSSGVCGN